ncbi:hypothetical protein MIR68_012659 [Amoeboaphelidium protococcarum]|nr:hypothetical protein MIR68_012659 [Amoeboaphelidium protococcarum]
MASKQIVNKAPQEAGLYLVPLVYTGQGDVLVPTDQVSCQVNVINLLCHNRVTQTFKVSAIQNAADVVGDVEAIYRLPLVDRALINGLEINIDGRNITTSISDADTGNNQEDMIAQMDKPKRELLQINMGQLKANSIVTVSISMLYELKNYSQQCVNYVIPTHLIGKDWKEDHKVSFKASIHFQMLSQIKNIVSSVPDAQIELNCGRDANKRVVKEEDKARHAQVNVDLKLSKEDLSSEHTLSIYTAKWGQSMAITEFNPKTKTYCTMLDLCPQFKQGEGEMKCDFVICFDMTSQMVGGKAYRMKQAIQVLLKSLPEDCFFNLIGFGAGCAAMQPYKSLINGPDAQEMATAFLDGIQPDMGAKRDLEVFKNAFTEIKLQPNYRRQIFVITGGEFEKADEVLKYVRSQANGGRGRLFCVGVGKASNPAFLEKLGSYGSGEAYFVNSQDRLELKMLAMLKKAMQHGARNFRVRWVDNKVFQSAAPSTPESASVKSKDGSAKTFGMKDLFTVDEADVAKQESYKFDEHVLCQTPADIHSLYVGKRTSVFAFTKLPAQLLKELFLSAASTEGPQDFTAEVVNSVMIVGENDVPIIHTMAAKRLINDLEDNRSYFHIGLPFHPTLEAKKRSPSHVDAKDISATIVKLGKEYNLMTSKTSLIATNEFGEQLKKTDLSINWIIPSHRTANAKALSPRGQTPSPSPIKSQLSDKKDSSSGDVKGLGSRSSRTSLFSFKRKDLSKTPANAPAPSVDSGKGSSLAPGGGQSFVETHISQGSDGGAKMSQLSSDHYGNTSASMSRISADGEGTATEASNFQEPPANDKYSIIVSLLRFQQADGSFVWKNELVDQLSLLPQAPGQQQQSDQNQASLAEDDKSTIYRNDISGKVNSGKSQVILDPNAEEQQAVWATLLVLAYFEIHLPGERDIIAQSEKKASKWLDQPQQLGYLSVSKDQAVDAARSVYA